jgi:cytoskeletal protein CcmA (bactofilin family)
MGSLSNLYISSSFQSLIHLGNDNTASTAYTVLQDGFGNDLGVSLNTRGEIKSAGLLVSGAVDINTFFSGSTQGFINQSSINNLIRITGSYTASGNEASITEIGIGWLVNGGQLQNGRVIGITGTPNVDVTYTIDQFYTANNVTYTFTGSIERAVEITGDLSVSDDLFVGGHLTIEDGVEITGSIDITGDVTASNAWIQGDLVVSGTINAYEIITTIESASVIFSSGSNILGDATNDTQTLIGDVIMSGSSSLTGSMGITGNLNVLGNISSSTISGIGNVSAYSAAVDSRLDFLEGPFSTSVDFRLDELENWSSSLQTNFATTAELTQTASFLQNQINQKLNTSSFNSYTSSTDNRLNNLESTSASVNISLSNLNTFSASTITRLNGLSSSTASYATTGSNTFIGNEVFSGSVRGVVIPLTITSQTASMDLSLGNFFTLTLPTSSITFLNPTNIRPGETVQLLVKQQSPTGSLNYPSSFLFPTGSDYSASVFANSQDILSFVSFDTTSLYAVSIKNLV